MNKCDKIPYTLERANKVLKDAKDKRRKTDGKHKHKVRQSYLCADCGMWHLTSVKFSKQELEKRQEGHRLQKLADNICKQNKWDC